MKTLNETSDHRLNLITLRVNSLVRNLYGFTANHLMEVA